MIPLFRPSCSDAEIEAVTAVLRSGWWGRGPQTGELERRFAQFAGTEHAVAMNSATMALQLTCEAMQVRGGEIIMPALTFASTALAAVHNGCRVVFADVDEDTLCLDWADAAAKLTPQTRAVIPVWYGGTVSEPGKAWRERPAQFHALPVIEDCAHAAGSPGAGRQGFAGCWSFHAVKNLAAGDGGMVTTNSAELAARLRRLHWCGIDASTWERDQGKYLWEYGITTAGWKAHMNDITAALALVQLDRLAELNGARVKIVKRYLGGLGTLDWLRLPRWRDGSAWHLFPVRVPEYLRDEFIRHMTRKGVSAGVHFKPLNTYPVFGDPQPLPVTDRVWKTLVSLPLFPDMTPGQIETVIAAVQDFQP
jgi:perosamine synthetase